VIEANPKLFVGFSNITALHVAIRQRTGMPTFYGYGLVGVGDPETTVFTRKRMLQLLGGDAAGGLPPNPDDPYVPGEIVERGPVEELYHDPRHPYTRLLFAATPDLDGESTPVSIPGSPPRLDRPLEGSPFQSRCDRAFERCGVERPLLRELDAGRAAACHLNDVPAEVA
jgi:oligopeptide/dipeptide ABC transporter ATP-binding protein